MIVVAVRDRKIPAGFNMVGRMAEKKITKHEIKTRETRALLLQAAEAIFVRDGYEGAELGEIAALAGRTKGAIYAHFKSKEDVFLALIEEHTQRRRTEMRGLITGSKSVGENLVAMRTMALKLSEDRCWAMLLLEFKLYALRHPEAQERLQRQMDELIPENREKQLTELLGPAAKGKDAVRRTVAVHTLQPLLAALAVESNFLPQLFDAATVKKLTGRIFDALMLDE